jgi:hypothetical protein
MDDGSKFRGYVVGIGGCGIGVDDRIEGLFEGINVVVEIGICGEEIDEGCNPVIDIGTSSDVRVTRPVAKETGGPVGSVLG